VHHRVITPGAIERIQIEFDTAGVCTDVERSDQIFVRARLLDGNGTTVPVSDRETEFSTNGRFAIVGPTKLMTEAGIATALVQVSPGEVEANVFAVSGALRQSATFRESSCREVFHGPR
jgi:beta-galactosidase